MFGVCVFCFVLTCSHIWFHSLRERNSTEDSTLPPAWSGELWVLGELEKRDAGAVSRAPFLEALRLPMLRMILACKDKHFLYCQGWKCKPLQLTGLPAESELNFLWFLPSVQNSDPNPPVRWNPVSWSCPLVQIMNSPRGKKCSFLYFPS